MNYIIEDSLNDPNIYSDSYIIKFSEKTITIVNKLNNDQLCILAYATFLRHKLNPNILGEWASCVDIFDAFLNRYQLNKVILSAKNPCLTFFAYASEKIDSLQILVKDFTGLKAKEQVFLSSFKNITLLADKVSGSLLLPSLEAKAKSSHLDQNKFNPRAEKKLVIIIAYYAGEAKVVGAQRVNYWFNNLQNILGPEYEVIIVSACRPKTKYEEQHNYIWIPDHHDLSYASSSNHDKRTQASEQLLAKQLDTTGFYWKYDVLDYINKLADHQNANLHSVILSGNPFCYFEIGHEIKYLMGCNVILDYRDPLAKNPRMKRSDDTRNFLYYLEKNYSFAADLIIVVNANCVERCIADPDIPIKVIPNGYDESLIEDKLQKTSASPVPPSQITFVHVGSFAHDRDPSILLSCLKKKGYSLDHFGSPFGQVGYPEHEDLPINNMGLIDNHLLYMHLTGYNYGIVFITESGFETPTKTYDYIAMGLGIIIVKPDTCLSPVILDELNEYRKLRPVFICNNLSNDISIMMEKLTTFPSSIAPCFSYSRKASTSLLADAIKQL